MAKLIRRDTGEEHALPDGVTQIGRLSANDIQVFEREVSRSHCHIEGPEGGWVIVDHGTQLGTSVNGRRTRLRGLYSGDEIKIGSAVFVFEGGEPAGRPPAARHLHPLSEASPERLVPLDVWEAPDAAGDPRGADAQPGQAAAPDGSGPARRGLRSAAGGAARALAALPRLVAKGALASFRRRAPRRLLERAAARLRQRDADGLWELLSAECRQQGELGSLRAKLASLPEQAIEAATRLEIGAQRSVENGVAVDVSVKADGERVADEVVVCREGRDWRIHSVPSELVRHVLSLAEGDGGRAAE